MNLKLWASIALLTFLTACGGGGSGGEAEAPIVVPSPSPVVKHDVKQTLLIGAEDTVTVGYALARLTSGGVDTLQEDGCSRPSFSMNPATGLVEIHCGLGGAYRLNTTTGVVTWNTLISSGYTEYATVACARTGTCYFGSGIYAPFGSLPSVTDLRVINAHGTLVGEFRFPDEKNMRVPSVLGMSTVAGRETLVGVSFDVAERDIAIHRFDTATQTFVGSCVIPGRFEKAVVDGGHVALTMPRIPNDERSPDVLVVDATTCATVATLRAPTDAPEVVRAVVNALVLRGDVLTVTVATFQADPTLYGVFQYNIRTGALTKELRLQASPFGLTESRSQGKFYTTMVDELLEIDAKTFEVLRRIPGKFYTASLFFAEE